MEFIVFLFGLVVGSFLNVVADRLPKGADIVWNPSHCDFCKRKLRWFELVPVLSFVLQQGRCRRCRHRLSVQYPIVECVTGFGFVLLFLWGYASLLMYIATLVLFSAFLAIFIIDLKHMIIPDVLLVVILLASFVFFPQLTAQLRFSHAVTAASSGAFFFLLFVITRGRGLGFGDVKLAALMGLLLGPINTIISFYVAFLTGATWGVILILQRRARMKSRIAFGPFLILGFAVAYRYGAEIYRWWLSFL